MSFRFLLVILFVTSNIFCISGCGNKKNQGTQILENISCETDFNVDQLVEAVKVNTPPDSGIYQLTSVSYTWVINEDKVVGLSSVKNNNKGKRQHQFQIKCPLKGKLKTSVGEIVELENISLPEQIYIDSNGQALLDEEFDYFESVLIAKKDQLFFEFGHIGRTSPEKEELTSNRLSFFEGISVVSSKDGVILTLNLGGEFQATHILFYERTGNLPAYLGGGNEGIQSPQTTENTDEKSFTKEECITMTAVNLAGLSKDMIYFSKNCDTLWVQASELRFEINSHFLNGPNKPIQNTTECVLVNFITAGLIISNSISKGVHKLNAANPEPRNYSIRPALIPKQQSVIYRKQSGQDSFSISGLTDTELVLDPGYESVILVGGVSSKVVLGPISACSLYNDFLNMDSNSESQEKIIDFIKETFDIKSAELQESISFG